MDARVASTVMPICVLLLAGCLGFDAGSEVTPQIDISSYQGCQLKFPHGANMTCTDTMNRLDFHGGEMPVGWIHTCTVGDVRHQASNYWNPALQQMAIKTWIHPLLPSKSWVLSLGQDAAAKVFVWHQEEQDGYVVLPRDPAPSDDAVIRAFNTSFSTNIPELFGAELDYLWEINQGNEYLVHRLTDVNGTVFHFTAYRPWPADPSYVMVPVNLSEGDEYLHLDYWTTGATLYRVNPLFRC